MIPPGRKLSDVCSPSRHFTTLRVVTLPSKKTSQRDTPRETASQPTQVSPNHTASSASPASDEGYTHQYSSPVKPGTGAINPTVPWTEVAIEQTSPREENRQMPLLRRSSDQLAHKDNPGPKEVKLSKRPVVTQLKSADASKDMQVEQPRENEQSEQVNNVKSIAACPVSRKEAPKITAHRSPSEESDPQIAQERDDGPFSEEPYGIRNTPRKNEVATSMHTSLSDDAKPRENYMLVEGKGIASQENLQVGIGFAPLESELTGHQQYVITPPRAQASPSGYQVQAIDAEMRDVKHSSDSRKRGVKKDLVSKSCPPTLRAVSPRVNLNRNEPQEKNQRTMQRAALTKIKDSSQIGRGRNKVTGGEEAIITEACLAQVGHTSHSESPQLTQQVQESKSVDQVDCHIIDLIAKIEQESAEQKRERFVRITDATQKWCGCLPKAHQERIISLGEKFLKRMDSTLCFLIVVYRMLAKANWTRSMVAVDVKQAALYAISKGWHVKAVDFHDYPCTREEFAVSAATYLDKIPADAPEDPFRALCIAISHLPPSCAKLFSKGKVSCPYCSASCDISFPSFTSRVSWTMSNWIDLATCLNSAEPNPWMQSYGWHATDCNRSDHTPSVTAFESWTLLELHLHQPVDFPTLIDSQKLTGDPSLTVMNGQILGFVCTNTRDFDDPSMHYWFIEVEDGALRYAFDSLKGLQRLTQDLAKKLIVTGVLIFFGSKKSPVLRSSELDSAAGVIPRVVRTSKPIRALGRLRANKVRSFLCREHGVKKRRHKPTKPRKTLFPIESRKPKELKAKIAGAVTLPAKGGKNSSRGSCGNKPIPPAYQRSYA